jgi:Asp-tRNA(Asn)/Glu-tRNA(Gln) amidotransferase A subunit family amidase
MSPPVALHTQPAWRTAQKVASGELSCQAVVQAYLDRAQERQPVVQAFCSLDADFALAQARRLDARGLSGSFGPLGALHGLPLGVKDLLDSADLPTTYGSPLYAGHRPQSDAAAVALCRDAGAVVLGKTVSTELAYFHPGPTRNPHALTHTPGGSSSGSAAAVADGQVPLALGTQTAGSIIRPAAFCGVVGFKPSWGRVPLAGAKSLSPSQDVVGGFARTVRDVALLGATLLSDPRLLLDGSAPPAPRIGLCRTAQWPLAGADTQRAVHQATAALAPWAVAWGEVEGEDLPDLVDTQKGVMAFEMARALSHERCQWGDRLSPPLQALMAQGMALTGADHQRLLHHTAAARRRVLALFERFDVLLAPSAIGQAPAGLEATGDPVFCRGWTLLGLPSVHLPFTTGSQGLPLGLQLVAAHGQDHRLLAFAQWVHERLQHQDQAEPLVHTQGPGRR